MLSELLAILVAAGCVCGGAVVARRQGLFHACWLAGTGYFALRLAGVTWDACVQQIRAEKLLPDGASIPAGFLAVFVTALVVGALLHRFAGQNGRGLPFAPPLERWGPEVVGGLAGALAFLGVAQAFLFTPAVVARVPGTLAFARGLLVALGQPLPP